MAGTELATAYLALVPSMQGAEGNIARALAPAAAEGDKAGAATGNRFMAAMGSPLGKVGVLMAGAFAVDKIVDGVKGLYNVGATFDDVADTIRIGTGASGDALDGLIDVAKEVGTSVPTSFEQAGSTVADLNTRLGLSGDTLSTVAQQYIQAGNILGEAVDIEKTTAAFNAFGLEGAQVEGAMDSLFQVSQATGVGFNDLASSVQTSAPALQNLGFSFEEAAGLAGTLGKAGINTNAVMASMSKGMITLAKDGEEPAGAFKRVTGEIGDFIAKGDTAGALNLASKVFGTKGAAQFVGALQSGTLNMEDLANVAGMTGDTILGLGEDTADAAESWQLIKNKGIAALEPLGTLLFNGVGAGLAFVAENMDGPINGLSALGDGISGVWDILTAGDFTGPIFGLEEDSGLVDFLFNLRDGAAELWGAVGPLVGQLLDLWTSVSPLSIVFSALAPLLPQLAGMLGDLASTLGGVLGGVLATVIPLVGQLSAIFIDLLSGVLATVLPVVVSVLMSFGETLQQIWPIVGVLLETVVGLAGTLLEGLIPVLVTIITSVLPVAAELFLAVVAAVLPLVEMLAGALIPILNALMPVVLTVFGVIVSVITAAMQIVTGIIQVATAILTGNWSLAWTGIQNILSGAWNLIIAVVTGAGQIIVSVIQAALSLLSSAWNAGWNAVFGFVSGMLSNIGNAIRNGITSAKDTAINIFTAMVSWVSGLPGRVLAGVSALAGLAGNFAAWVGGAKDAAVGKFSELVGWVSGLPGRVLSALGNVGGLLRGAGSDLVRGMIGGIQDMVGSLADTAANMAKSALDAAKNFLGIKSPSRKARAELGQQLGAGFILGVDDMQDKARAAMEDLVSLPAAPSFASSASAARYAEAAAYPAAYGSSAAAVPGLTIEGDVYAATPEEIVEGIGDAWRRGVIVNNLQAIKADAL